MLWSTVQLAWNQGVMSKDLRKATITLGKGSKHRCLSHRDECVREGIWDDYDIGYSDGGSDKNSGFKQGGGCLDQNFAIKITV